MANKSNLLNHRLRALATVLSWEGELTNKRVRDLFGLQNVQASRLIFEFRTAYGHLISADDGGRALLLNRAVAEKAPIEDYVGILREALDNTIVIEDVRTDLGMVNPAIFAEIRSASLNRSGVDIRYASMTHPEGTKRTIYPHAIVRAGRRWHVRAWCELRKEYRDFAFGRILEAKHTNKKPGRLAADAEWTKLINLELTTHRDLEKKQSRVVCDEYFEGKPSKVIQCRACLASYLLQDLRVATEPDNQLPPAYQLELINITDVKNYLW